MNLQPGNPIVALTRSVPPGVAAMHGIIYNSGSLEDFDRPDYVTGQSLYVSNPTPKQYLNPNAFARRNLGFGNAGRNILTAPGLQDVDVALSETRASKSESPFNFGPKH